MKFERPIPDIDKLLNSSLVIDACRIAREKGAVISRQKMARMLISNGMIDVYGEPTLTAINEGLVYKKITYRKDTDE